MTENNIISFNDPETRAILLSWWSRLDDDRKSRAMLRRWRNRHDVALVPAFHHLYWSLKKDHMVSIEKLASIAGVLSHVTSNDHHGTFAQQMAAPKDIDSKNERVSNQRFRRLLNVDNYDDLYITIIRMIRLLGGSVNIANLANGMYWWNEQTKENMAFSYYGNVIKKQNGE